jgi:YHS domain-containing protein
MARGRAPGIFLPEVIMRQSKLLLALGVLLVFDLGLALQACQSETTSNPPQQTEKPAAQGSSATNQMAIVAKVERVEAKKVCMVNDAVFPSDQIPIEVKGRTYYGCCEMCKGRLSNDPQVRWAVDPVSKKRVDKALAVIGAKPDGKVLYFESEKTLRQYNSGAGR